MRVNYSKNENRFKFITFTYTLMALVNKPIKYLLYLRLFIEKFRSKAR